MLVVRNRICIISHYIFFNYCWEYDIKLHPQWIPRDFNRDADYFSKIKDGDSWGVDRETFMILFRVDFDRLTLTDLQTIVMLNSLFLIRSTIVLVPSTLKRLPTTGRE